MAAVHLMAAFGQTVYIKLTPPEAVQTLPGADAKVDADAEGASDSKHGAPGGQSSYTLPVIRLGSRFGWEPPAVSEGSITNRVGSTVRLGSPASVSRKLAIAGAEAEAGASGNLAGLRLGSALDQRPSSPAAREASAWSMVSPNHMNLSVTSATHRGEEQDSGQPSSAAAKVCMGCKGHGLEVGSCGEDADQLHGHPSLHCISGVLNPAALN